MKNYFITGASKGLGLKTVETLLNEGHNIYCTSRTMSGELSELKNKFNNQLNWVSADLQDPNLDIKTLMLNSSFINNKVALHGFVNNAAVAYDDIITNLNGEKLAQMYQANVFAPMMITKYCLRNMLFNRVQGSIIHISSISVHTGYKGLAMYASTKGALEAFSKNCAREWGELSIRSNSIVAGFMETNMSSTLSMDQKNRIYNRTSLKKPTEVESVAETIAFLLSDKAKSITGQNIFVDSGTI